MRLRLKKLHFMNKWSLFPRESFCIKVFLPSILYSFPKKKEILTVLGAQNRPEKRPKYCIDLMKCMVECKINTYIEKVQHKKTNPCMKPLLMCFFLSFKLSRKGILIIKVFHVWFSAYQMEAYSITYPKNALSLLF